MKSNVSVSTLIVFAISLLLATFAVVTLSHQPAIAQGSIDVGSHFLPRQFDLYSLSASDLTPVDPEVWGHNNGGLFTVTADGAHRLPSITEMHNGNGTVPYYNFNVSLADVTTHTISQALLSSNAFHGDSLGVTLKPGTYFIQWDTNEGVGDKRRLLLSGYWARK